MVTHIFKNGTTTTELKNVYVPSEIVEMVRSIVKEEKRDEEESKAVS